MTIFNYTVNIVDVVLSVIFIISAFVGYKKGLLLTLINIIRYAVGYSLCFYCCESLSQFVYDAFLKQIAVDYVNTNIVSATGIDDTMQNIANIKSTLPTFFAGIINVDSISVPTGDDIALYLVNTILEPVIIGAAKILIFILVYLLFFGSTWLIIRLLTKASKRREKHRKEKNKKKSLSKRTNQILGAVFGIIKSAVLVLAFVMILKSVQSMLDTSGAFYQALDGSFIIKYINSINPFNELIGGTI